MNELVPTGDRNNKGQFVKGNSATTTNRYGKFNRCLTPTALRHAMISCVKPKDIKNATKKLIEMMEDPNPKIRLGAIELLFNRVFGAPSQKMDLEVSQVQDVYTDMTEEQIRELLAQRVA